MTRADGTETFKNQWHRTVAVQHNMGLAADAVLRLGCMFMGAGTGGYRVTRGMKRAARALGFDRLDAVVGVNTLTCTFHRGEQFRTVVANQHNPAVNASQIEALEYLTHHLHHEITVSQLNEALDHIAKHCGGPRWSRLTLALASGFACAAFAVLNHYSWPEVPVVGVGAFAGQWVRSMLAKRHFNQLGTAAVAGAASAIVYYLLTMIVGWVHSGTDVTSFAAGYVAAALFLIPGFPLFSALLDLSRFDIVAGISRLTYALSIILTATISVGMVSLVSGLNPLPAKPGPADAFWFLSAGVASFIGVAGFSILFNCSKRMVLIASCVATVGNEIRQVMLALHVQPQFCAFVAGLTIGLIVAAVARYARVPRITMTVPASVIMIPGVAMYKSMYYLNSGDMDHAISFAALAALVVIFIAAGLALARMLTDRDWAFGRAIDLRKPLNPEEDQEEIPDMPDPTKLLKKIAEHTHSLNPGHGSKNHVKTENVKKSAAGSSHDLEKLKFALDVPIHSDHRPEKRG